MLHSKAQIDGAVSAAMLLVRVRVLVLVLVLVCKRDGNKDGSTE
jgi:hypothetical protein